jgi:chitin disaccharide deacetylase
VDATVDPSSARRRIWLCADDYGISPAVNTAIRDLVVRCRINATSVMVVAPSLQGAEAAALDILNRNAPHVAIGLHLTLTAPFQPLSKGFAPLRDGAFQSLETLLLQACMRRLRADALAAEVGAQLRRFIEIFGRAPDFIDGHQHVHLFPQVSEAVLKVAKARAPGTWVRQCGSRLPIVGTWRDHKGLLLDILSFRFRRRAAALGVPTNPAFAGTYAFKQDANFADMFPRFLDGLPDGSVVMCHPGFVDDELRRLDPLTTLREQEYAFFSDDAFPDVLARQSVALQSP